MKGAVRRLKELRRTISCNKQLVKEHSRLETCARVMQGSAACSIGLIYYDLGELRAHARTHAEHFLFSVDFGAQV